MTVKAEQRKRGYGMSKRADKECGEIKGEKNYGKSGYRFVLRRLPRGHGRH